MQFSFVLFFIPDNASSGTNILGFLHVVTGATDLAMYMADGSAEVRRESVVRSGHMNLGRAGGTVTLLWLLKCVQVRAAGDSFNFFARAFLRPICDVVG